MARAVVPPDTSVSPPWGTAAGVLAGGKCSLGEIKQIEPQTLRRIHNSGNSTSHCGAGCDPKFGTCGPKLTLDGTCGGTNGFLCHSQVGNCCSDHGYWFVYLPDSLYNFCSIGLISRFL